MRRWSGGDLTYLSFRQSDISMLTCGTIGNFRLTFYHPIVAQIWFIGKCEQNIILPRKNIDLLAVSLKILVFTLYINYLIQSYTGFYATMSICKNLYSRLSFTSMIPPVQQLTSPDRVRPSPVQSSPRNFWTGLGPIPNFSGPGLNWPGLLWTSPFGPNRPEYAWSY